MRYDEIGLYVTPNRTYVPGIGRWLQMDPAGFVDGLNRYAYTANNPLNAVDPDGLRIVLMAHEVGLGNYHTKIAIIPEDQDKYRNVAGFFRGPSGEYMEFMGAGPSNNPVSTLMGNGGNLYKGINRPTDVRAAPAFQENLKIPEGKTEDDMIGSLTSAFNNYRNNEKYTLFPRPGKDEYNSNSFTHGLLDAAGFDDVQKPDLNTPGFSNPLPRQDFKSKPTPFPGWSFDGSRITGSRLCASRLSCQ